MWCARVSGGRCFCRRGGRVRRGSRIRNRLCGWRSRGGGVLVIAQTTAPLPVRRGGVGIIGPQFFTVIDRQRQNFAVRGTNEQFIAYLERCVLVFSAGAVALWDIASMGNPRDLKFVDVGFIDLIQCSETVTGGGVTPAFPVFLFCTRRDRFYRCLIVVGADDWRRHEGVTENGNQRNGQHGCQREAWAFTGNQPRACFQQRICQRGQEGQNAEGEQAGEERPECQTCIPDGPDN